MAHVTMAVPHVKDASHHPEERNRKLRLLSDSHGYQKQQRGQNKNGIENFVGVIYYDPRRSYVPQHADDHNRPIEWVGGANAVFVLCVVDVLEQFVVEVVGS